MTAEKQPDMPLWEDQLWEIMHAMQYRSQIALVPLIAALFIRGYTPLMETIRVLALILALSVAWATIRQQQRMLRQLRDKYGHSNNGVQAIGDKSPQPDP